MQSIRQLDAKFSGVAAAAEVDGDESDSDSLLEVYYPQSLALLQHLKVIHKEQAALKHAGQQWEDELAALRRCHAVLHRSLAGPGLAAQYAQQLRQAADALASSQPDLVRLLQSPKQRNTATTDAASATTTTTTTDAAAAPAAAAVSGLDELLLLKSRLSEVQQLMYHSSIERAQVQKQIFDLLIYLGRNEEAQKWYHRAQAQTQSEDTQEEMGEVEDDEEEDEEEEEVDGVNEAGEVDGATNEDDATVDGDEEVEQSAVSSHFAPFTSSQAAAAAYRTAPVHPLHAAPSVTTTTATPVVPPLNIPTWRN